MFDYSLIHWTTFLTTAVLLNLSPGPDMAFILGQTLRSGRRSGFAAMAGVWTGGFMHVLFAAAGVSAILASSATAFTLVKWAGAAYLVYLGLSALRSGGTTFTADTSAKRTSGLRIWRQGVLVSLLNPKVAIFFLAFLPQFVVPGAGPVWAQLLLHGVLVIVAAMIIEPLFVLLGEGLTRTLRSRPRAGRLLDRVLGTVLVSLGIKLALTQR
ncbi:LysE family translocator [Falsirhodobacter deserti]|uniref:LysE family translocator n=1 Tax=Falsirhodobacter deserti TaxID=1365611 RepID=UPI000FE38E66|nr:LysE family translocator [Falsirhodobacter deserti]